VTVPANRFSPEVFLQALAGCWILRYVRGEGNPLIFSRKTLVNPWRGEYKFFWFLRIQAF
jgi:hypothetical protein